MLRAASYVEGVIADVSMITWPMFADEFLNEKLVMDVARIGVSLEVKSPSGWMEERPGAAAAVPVEREEIWEAVERVMDPGEEGEERRRRARELGKKAREAIGEGGSSYWNLIAHVNAHVHCQSPKPESTRISPSSSSSAVVTVDRDPSLVSERGLPPPPWLSPSRAHSVDKPCRRHPGLLASSITARRYSRGVKGIAVQRQFFTPDPEDTVVEALSHAFLLIEPPPAS